MSVFHKKENEEELCPSCGHSHKPGTCCGDCGCCFEERGYALDGEEHEEEEQSYTVPAFAIAGVLLLFDFLLTHFSFLSFVPSFVATVLSLAVFAFYGIPILIHTGKEISHGDFFTEGTLMSFATVGALCIGEFFEAAAVMFLYSVGEYLSDKAFDRSKEKIAMILDLSEKTVHVRKGTSFVEKKPEEIERGDVIPVVSGEKIPVDGVLTVGSADFDTSSITGESIPVSLSVGERVLSGYLCLNGSVEMTADRPYDESTASRLVDAVTEAGKRKSKNENFIRSFAKTYTPAMMLAAVIVFAFGSLFSGEPLLWLKKALTLLVISCPCALVLSVPLAYFSSIGAGARIGILFKGGEAVDAAAKIGVIAFDKTGTLTQSKIRVDRIVPAISSREFLALSSAVLSRSSHPLAKAFSAENPDRFNIMIEECREIPGKGTAALVEIDGHIATACFGSPLFLRERNPGIRFSEQEETAIYASLAGEYIGCILFSDTPKPRLAESIAHLKKLGISYM
ncbi:MAG: HAD-IC family P-type ATPase, partial [Ruminococcus sp.]|nr:HAD-IC family P-type ATPase [Candidatus Apopatosoma intestinale]